jgi:hypothetical protein
MLKFPDTFGVIFHPNRLLHPNGRVGALRRPDAAARRAYRCFNRIVKATQDFARSNLLTFVE